MLDLLNSSENLEIIRLINGSLRNGFFNEFCQKADCCLHLVFSLNLIEKYN